MRIALLLLAALAGCATGRPLRDRATESANKDRVSTFVDEVYNGRRFDRIPEYIPPEFVDRSPGIAAPPPHGPAFVRKQVDDTFREFPDLRFEIRHLIAEGDLVLIHWRATGSSSQRPGSPVTLQGHSLFRMRDGKVLESWDIVDRLGLLEQLGFTLQPPAEPR